jgi:hypothetical protein
VRTISTQRSVISLLGESYLFGRVGVDVELRVSRLDRLEDLPVVRVILVRVDAALDAHLGGAARHRVVALLEDLLHAAVVGVGLVAVAREAAERAADVADVGEVDVAADDEGHVVALVLAAREVGGEQQRAVLGAARRQHRDDVLLAELAAGERPVEHAREIGLHVGEQSLQHQAASRERRGGACMSCAAAASTALYSFASKNSGRRGWRG